LEDDAENEELKKALEEADEKLKEATEEFNRAPADIEMAKDEKKKAEEDYAAAKAEFDDTNYYADADAKKEEWTTAKEATEAFSEVRAKAGTRTALEY
jgi:septum formation inhibitor MinC